MLPTVLHSKTTSTIEQFWKAVNIWNTNPHVVNRRLCGAICIFTGKLLNMHKDHDDVLSQVRAACVEIHSSMTDNDILQALQSADIEVGITSDLLENEVYIIIKKLMPRNSDKFQECLELAIIDKLQNEALFVGLRDEASGPDLIPCFPYSFSYIEDKREIHLNFRIENKIESASKDWLKEKLFPKFIKWTESAKSSSEDSGLVTSSLSLINIIKYNQLYQELKKKYGSEMVKIWPENTDPLKFVYEDVAIATYMLLLWEEERLEKGTPYVYQTFVDLGCGNGLLVHILNSEGHQGVGLDVRKRAIWDLYPSTTKLEVRSIIPSTESLFPDADWIIGNHSDELTPWIPVIAARSSYSCRFFLLPCCSYEFNGRKYQRIDSSRSQYEDYLEYIYNLCRSCGFVTKPDRLKIPSTKRLCFVGFGRNYAEEYYEKMDREIQKLIDSTAVGSMRQSEDSKEEENNKWSQEFKPRENVERIRNCTQLDKNLIQDIVSLIAKELLSKENLVIVNDGSEDKSWNKGGILTLGDLVSLVPREKLKSLKNECGGLQTLLKNKGNIFLVQNGQVQLKMPSVNMKLQKKKVGRNLKSRDNLNIEAIKKQKPCWFYVNHPHGCPLSESDCSYKH